MEDTKFKINLKISKSINADIAVVKAKVLTALEKNGYEINVKNEMNISFNNYGTPFFRVRGTSSNKLREGVFELVKQNNETLIILNFRIPFLSLLMAFIALVFLGFLWGWGVLFINGLFIIGFIFEIAQQKDSAKQLLFSITNMG